ncbi:hypothetical protein H0H93_007338, partial [Arthromyces matolae]
MTHNSQQLIRYSTSPVMQKIELSLADPLCKTLFSGIIDTVPLNYRFTPLDIDAHLNQGVVTYTLDKEVANSLWVPLRRLAQFVHCAAYNFNPYATQMPLPSSISLAKLVEINVEAPDLSRVIATPIHNPLLGHFPSARLLRDRIVLIQRAIESALEWIGKALEATLTRGDDCSWNWGAYWGIERGDFLERVEGAVLRKSNVKDKEVIRDVDINMDLAL